jgi:prevent-host-death family protein
MPDAREWQLQEAKNRLSEVVRLSQRKPQTITLHGKPSAVVVSYQEFRRLSQPKMGLLEVMRSAPEDFSELVPPRSDDATLRELGL